MELILNLMAPTCQSGDKGNKRLKASGTKRNIWRGMLQLIRFSGGWSVTQMVISRDPLRDSVSKVKMDSVTVQLLLEIRTETQDFQRRESKTDRDNYKFRIKLDRRLCKGRVLTTDRK